MKFRRKASQPTEAAASEVRAAAPGTPGPWDVSEVDLEQGERVDLGAMLIEPSAGRELRLQVDEASGLVRAVILAGEEGAMELQVFAAPRNGDLWESVRPQIAEDLDRRGGNWTEREGRWGTELLCQLPATLPDGSPGVQPSRIVGVNGARWLLRATFMGAPAINPEADPTWDDALATVVVRRGDGAMPVGEPIAVTLPADARRVR